MTNFQKDDIVHVVGGEFDGANGIVLKIVNDKAIVSLKGIGIERVPIRFLTIPK